MAVQATANIKNPLLMTPAAIKATAMANMGRQHAIIIQP